MKFKGLTGKADYYIIIGGNTMGGMSALDRN